MDGGNDMIGRKLLLGTLLFMLTAVCAPSVDAVEVTYGDWMPYTGLEGMPDNIVKVLEQGEQDCDNYHYSGGRGGIPGAEVQEFKVTWSTPFEGVHDCDQRAVYHDGDFHHWHRRAFGLGYQWSCGGDANGSMTQGNDTSIFTPGPTPKECIVITVTVKDQWWREFPDYTGMDPDGDTLTFDQPVKTFRVKVRMNAGNDYAIYEDQDDLDLWITAYEGNGLEQSVVTGIVQTQTLLSDEDTWTKDITWTPIAETSASQVTGTRKNITFRPMLDFSGKLQHWYQNSAACLDISTELNVVAAAASSPYVKAVAKATPDLGGLCSYCAGYIAGASTIENADSKTFMWEKDHCHSPQLLLQVLNLNTLDIPGSNFSLEPGGGPVRGSFEITTGAWLKDWSIFHGLISEIQKVGEDDVFAKIGVTRPTY
jgi:hypothetical protein